MLNDTSVSDKPLLSICIPNYNYGCYLKRCLDSVLIETTSQIEVLISDNASTDDSWTIIKSYQDCRLRIWRQTENIGAQANWNFVLTKASGRFFQLLPSDDWMVKGYFTVFQKALKDGLFLAGSLDNIIAVLRPSLPASYVGNVMILGSIRAKGKDKTEQIFCANNYCELLYGRNSYSGECTYNTDALRKAGGYPVQRWHTDAYAFFNIMSSFPDGIIIYTPQPMCVNHMHPKAARNTGVGYLSAMEQLDFVHWFSHRHLGFYGRVRWLWWDASLNARIWINIALGWLLKLRNFLYAYHTKNERTDPALSFVRQIPLPMYRRAFALAAVPVVGVPIVMRLLRRVIKPVCKNK